MSLKEIVTDAIESHIKLLFDKKGLIPQITPDCMLLQIFYKEVDEALFHKQSQLIKNEQQDEKIDIGWTKSTMTLSEYK